MIVLKLEDFKSEVLQPKVESKRKRFKKERRSARIKELKRIEENMLQLMAP